MRRFVIGDIHGRLDALKEVLDLSSFDYKKDLLICLGDVADGGPNTKECFDELLKIKNLIYVLGNHDYWFRMWFNTAEEARIWVSQGGRATIWSYGGDVMNVPDTHKALLNYEAVPYHLTEDGLLFVHGGIKPGLPLEEQTSHFMMWDRDIIEYAKFQPVPGVETIFIGHTSTQLIANDEDRTKPIKYHNLWCLDTGVGWNGKLTIMDVDTEEYWQSKAHKPLK